jgi:hypothetical protein
MITEEMILDAGRRRPSTLVHRPSTRDASLSLLETEEVRLLLRAEPDERQLRVLSRSVA